LVSPRVKAERADFRTRPTVHPRNMFAQREGPFMYEIADTLTRRIAHHHTLRQSTVDPRCKALEVLLRYSRGQRGRNRNLILDIDGLLPLQQCRAFALCPFTHLALRPCKTLHVACEFAEAARVSEDCLKTSQSAYPGILRMGISTSEYVTCISSSRAAASASRLTISCRCRCSSSNSLFGLLAASI